MQMDTPIILIGGGNMGGALARAWQKAALVPLHVVERDRERSAALRAAAIAVSDTLEAAPQQAAALVLAIKPQQFPELAPALLPLLAPDTLLISIMAGIPLAALHTLTPHAVRAMPNLPATVGEAMSVLCAAPGLPASAHALATRLFAAAGEARWVQTEAQLQAATAISGSGPGYFFAFMEALEAAALEHGLDAETARALVRQTAKGAGILAAQALESFTTLRQQVTSPGGTTEAALARFAQHGLTHVVKEAVTAALSRAEALARKG